LPPGRGCRGGGKELTILTVAIPFTGGPALLDLAVRSVFAQSMPDWRLLLVADGASEDSLALVSRIRDPRVDLLGDGQRLGLAARLNQVAAACTTPYLARMDADDLMFPDRLERQLAALTSTGADVVGMRAVAIDPSGDVLGRFREGPLPVSPQGFLRSNAFTHPTVTGRTDWFRRHPYREDLRRAEDKELWLRGVRASSSCEKLPEPGLFYRLRPFTPRPMYRAMSRDERHILRAYGPRLDGRLGTLRRVGVTWGKQLANDLISVSPAAQRRWFESRYEPDPGQQPAWTALLEQVRSTDVPGLG